MNLDRIQIDEGPDRYESLALALRAIAAADGVEYDYDDLCAAMGVSFAAVSTSLEPEPSWWMTYGRDLFIEPAGRLFGFQVRPLHPPEVACDLPAAETYPQHWELSYVPLVQRALEHGQPVLAWRGWPAASAPFWGVITAASDDGRLQGVAMWSQGQKVEIAGQPLQCYVVESLVQNHLSGDALFAAAMQHADRYLNGAPFARKLGEVGPPPIVTGPAAYDAWERWLQRGGTPQEGAASEHRQHAELVASSRLSAGRFLRRMRAVAGPELATHIADAVDYCEAVVQWLDESRDQSTVEALMADPHGRERLLAAVSAAEASDRLLANCIEKITTALLSAQQR